MARRFLLEALVVKDQSSEGQSGLKAVGVEFEKSGNTQVAVANKEVISSAGSIGSVQLLQLSGIGPKAVLEKAGVELKHELSGVGENLQDHLEVYFQYHCNEPITLNSKLGLVSKGMIGAEWILTRKVWVPLTTLNRARSFVLAKD